MPRMAALVENGALHRKVIESLALAGARGTMLPCSWAGLVIDSGGGQWWLYKLPLAGGDCVFC